MIRFYCHHFFFFFFLKFWHFDLLIIRHLVLMCITHKSLSYWGKQKQIDWSRTSYCSLMRCSSLSGLISEREYHYNLMVWWIPRATTWRRNNFDYYLKINCDSTFHFNYVGNDVAFCIDFKIKSLQAVIRYIISVADMVLIENPYSGISLQQVNDTYQVWLSN